MALYLHSDTRGAHVLMQGPPDWHPAPKEVRETCAKAAAHAKAQGVSIERLAIQYAFQKENVSTVLIGMATPAEVRQLPAQEPALTLRS